MLTYEKRFLSLERWVAWGVFFILLASYWLTVPPTVSFWDCPEYVAAAYLLEIGHPPGNPVWMLVERIFTLLAPSPRYAALAINLSSGLFTAFAAFFLAKTIFRVGLWVLLKLPRRHIPAPVAAAGGATVGALAFGWCDSAWYSAVEAEVYAMSIFMTALCVWLMTKWAGTRSRPESWRILILIAYLFGLSIGVHQLNLLCIPALAMIWAVRRGIRTTLKLAYIFLLSLVAVACVLMGMMPSTIAIAAKFELLAVNGLGMPALSGVAAYVALLGVSLIIALTVTRRSESRLLMALACFPAIALSGIFTFSGHFAAGIIASAAASGLLVCGRNFKARRLSLAMWMLAMLLAGYSAYALIPVRGDIPSPANSAMPGEPYAFASYLSREQYGSNPLLYGRTPYSKSLIREEYDSAGHPQYRFYSLDYRNPILAPNEPGAHLRRHMPGMPPADSAANAALARRNADSYVVIGYRPSPVLTPELNMWFPRITSNNPSHIKSYAEWIGMTPESMTRLEVSEAIDSAGNFVAKNDGFGNRVKPVSYRPTYMQNLQWFLTYQTGYMYWRYLLWNFGGRQNDRPSQGEVQHGNFITGFPVIDNAMLGAEDHLPPAAGSDNRGRNIYWCLPLIIGLIGIGWLLKSRRRGIQTCAVTAILFVMTGIAIVIYLNQTPGEARERDYSFLGSFWAFSLWIGFGAIMIARRFRSAWGFVLPLAVAVWMAIVNFDDHDRSHRIVAREFAANVLNSLEEDAILFVNGDNFTFPLWYAQEVEGLRRDVRVVNLAYLSRPAYAANLMADWRDSRALPTTLTRGDIIWDAFINASVPAGSRDTLPAVEALRRLRLSDPAEFPVRYAELPVAPDSTIIFDLSTLKQGKGRVNFASLMMFDIIATNAQTPHPRPIYWQGSLSPDKRLGIKQLSFWLFGYRFGLIPDHVTDSLAVAAASGISPLNEPGKEAYVDYAPSSALSSQRGALTSAGRRLLRAGRIDDALRFARMADIYPGNQPTTFFNIRVADTLFNTRRELAALLSDCADSLAVRSQASDATLQKKSEAIILELKARSQYHLLGAEASKNAWNNYKRHLPPRLRSKMAPTY